MAFSDGAQRLALAQAEVAQLRGWAELRRRPPMGKRKSAGSFNLMGNHGKGIDLNEFDGKVIDKI